ncbi:hypothetical protein D3C78_942470 [compost metagenome]
MQCGHALLTHRVEARQRSLGTGDGVVVQVRNQAVCRGPGFVVGFPHDHMQTDTKAYFATLRGSLLPHLSDFLGNSGWWLAPGQVQLDLLGSKILGGFGRATEIQRRAWLLNGRIEQLGALHLDVLALVVDVLALQHLAPDTRELDRGFVALLVVQVQAITGQLVGVATGDQVEQRPAVGQAVQGCRLARRDRRRNDAWTQGNQEFQMLGHRDQRCCHQPGILAGTPGRDQHTTKAETVGGLGNLLQVTVIDRTGTLGCAQVLAVTVGGEEPENVKAHWSCLLKGGEGHSGAPAQANQSRRAGDLGRGCPDHVLDAQRLGNQLQRLEGVGDFLLCGHHLGGQRRGTVALALDRSQGDVGGQPEQRSNLVGHLLRVGL